MKSVRTNITVPCIRSYLFGFNGQLKDNEVYGEGNAYTAEFWEYDSRSGRRWNIDPMTGSYPGQSPYATFNNCPILVMDPLGLEGDPTPAQQKKLDRLQRKLDNGGKLNKKDSDFYGKWKNWDYDVTQGGTMQKAGNSGGYYSIEWEGSVLQQGYENLKNTQPGSHVTVNGNKYRIPDPYHDQTGMLDIGQFFEQQKNMAPGYYLMADILAIEAGLLVGSFGGGVSATLENQIAVNVSQRSTPLLARTTSLLSVSKAGSNTLIPLGLGSTGRVAATNVTEQLAMEEIMSNPTMGRVIKEGLSDPRWLGWSKMAWRNGGVEIHYVGKFENGILTAVDDFKFIGGQ